MCTPFPNQSDQTPLEVSLQPTPAEQSIIDYHRNTIKSGTVGTDKEGRPVTVYSTGLLVPEGKNKGKFVSVPGYVNGQIIEDEDRLYNIWKKEIEAGKFPIYKTGQELNKRSRELHKIMDDEEKAAITSRKNKTSR